jgi:hypothetical protein
MKLIVAILLVLSMWATPAESAMIISEPMANIEYWMIKVDGVDYHVTPMGVNMLMISMDEIEPGVHQIEVTGYVEEMPTEVVKFQLVKELSRKGTVYMAMVDEANAKFFEEPTKLFIPNDDPGGEQSNSNAKCFIGTLAGD